ncbi:MAG: diheme cytochrome c [Gammaproteobacteria bacterium]|nr:diheme cytochrome c [Gammaproteobacteria bacterium]
MKNFLIVTALLALILGLTAKLALSDDDHDGQERKWSDLFKPTSGVAPVLNKKYVTECSSCHMAYPAGLLPARSWEKIMLTLDSHFGENAELDPQSLSELTKYLVDNSADKSGYRRSKKIMRSLTEKDVPLRITETPYIMRKHDEIPQKLIKANPKVASLSNCIACHRNAENGSFNEHEINIPGYGHWED